MLAGLSFLGYVLAYTYEATYLSRYHVPPWMIEISLASVLSIVVLLVAVVLTANFLLMQLPRTTRSGWWALLTRLFRLALILGMILSLIWYVPWQHWSGKVFGSLLLLAFVLYFTLELLSSVVRPLVLHSGSIIDRFTTDYQQWLSSPDPNMFSAMLDRGARAGHPIGRYLGAMSLASLSFAFVIFTARSRSLTQSEFLVMRADPECIVLRKYNDRFICAPFDRQRREIYQAFRIVNTSDIASSLVVAERVGPMVTKPLPKIAADTVRSTRQRPDTAVPVKRDSAAPQRGDSVTRR